MGIELFQSFKVRFRRGKLAANLEIALGGRFMSARYVPIGDPSQLPEGVFTGIARRTSPPEDLSALFGQAARPEPLFRGDLS